MKSIKQFLATEAAGGVLLLCMGVLAMVLANTELAPLYFSLLELPAGVSFGSMRLEKALLHWINDGLMALFFLLIGLEVKRELLEGELSRPGQALLPLAGAVGGVVAPALIFLLFNHGTPALRGWAVPTATDIAFSLGIVALFGKRLPMPLKVFLMTLAVVDDLAAVLIIALIYTANISLSMMLSACGVTAVLILLNYIRVIRLTPYLVLGILLWFFVLKSGVHATIAGVILGLCIPLRCGRGEDSPLHVLQHWLHPWIAFGVMPIFALANAGIPLQGLSWQDILHPLTLGVALGLFAGKQLGIFAACRLVISLKLAHKMHGCSWLAWYGVCIIAGVGFTMSLFIGMLAFSSPADAMQLLHTRLGVMTGSLLSAIVGYIVLLFALRRSHI